MPVHYDKFFKGILKSGKLPVCAGFLGGLVKVNIASHLCKRFQFFFCKIDRNFQLFVHIQVRIINFYGVFCLA